jgi:hypothetical protein
MLRSGSMALSLEFSVVHVLGFVHILVLSSTILSVRYVVPSFRRSIVISFSAPILCHPNSGSISSFGSLQVPVQWFY